MATSSPTSPPSSPNPSPASPSSMTEMTVLAAPEHRPPSRTSDPTCSVHACPSRAFLHLKPPSVHRLSLVKSGNQDMEEEAEEKQYLDLLFEHELEAERVLLAKAQQQEMGILKEGNRQAQSALRRRARTTKTSVPSPFESMMKDIGEPGSRPLVQEVCRTCGDHDSNERTWMMFPGTDLFARIPFHAAHKILEEDEPHLDIEYNKLQSYIKERALSLSEKGALSDKIGPDVLRSLVTLKGKSKDRTSTDNALIEDLWRTKHQSSNIRI